MFFPFSKAFWSVILVAFWYKSLVCWPTLATLLGHPMLFGRTRLLEIRRPGGAGGLDAHPLAAGVAPGGAGAGGAHGFLSAGDSVGGGSSGVLACLSALKILDVGLERGRLGIESHRS